MPRQILRIGVGGPVGSGKTALLNSLCTALRDRFEIGVVTNDIYTREDAEFLIRHKALPEERIRGVERGVVRILPSARMPQSIWLQYTSFAKSFLNWISCWWKAVGTI